MWKQRNEITRIINSNGDWVSNKLQMEQTFETYFTTIFASFNPNFEFIDNALQYISLKVIDRMNDQLLAAFSRSKIERVIKQMHPSKTSGPDGFPAFFYQQYWTEVGETTILKFLDILNQKRSVRNWNDTYFALIPKVYQPKQVSDFRPMSLCNVSYKIIAKVLVNRMKWVLQDIISENQLAFVSGRSIFDNIIIGHECMHTIKSR